MVTRNFFPSILFWTLLAAVSASTQPSVEIVGGKTFDFGTLLTNRVVSRELAIRNGGNDTLKIWAVSGSCGCTGTLLSSDHLLPGEEGTLKITFDPAKFSGPVEKTVSMKTNDPADPNPHIAFRADIRRIIELDREYLLFTTQPDSEAVAELTIGNMSEQPITITGVQTGTADITTDLSRKVIPPGEHATLSCRLLTKNAGILKGDLVMKTDHPMVPELSLRYFSYVKPATPPAAGKGGK